MALHVSMLAIPRIFIIACHDSLIKKSPLLWATLLAQVKISNGCKIRDGDDISQGALFLLCLPGLMQNRADPEHAGRDYQDRKPCSNGLSKKRFYSCHRSAFFLGLC